MQDSLESIKTILNYKQRTIDILEVYAQDQVSDGRPFPSGTQSTQDLQPHFTANFT